MKQLHSITLFGRAYSFHTDVPNEHAEKVITHLANEIQRLETAESVKLVPQNETAILLSAALNIANAYLDLKNSHSEFTEELIRRVMKLTEKLTQVGHYPQNSLNGLV